MKTFQKCSINNFTYLGDGHYTITDGSINHDVYIKKSPSGSKQLIILGQGAVDKTKIQPDFQRVSWAKDIEHNIIICSDPTINDTNLNIGWFQHSIKTNYFYWFSLLVKSIAVKLDADVINPVLFGSSAGGFTTLMLSTYFKNPWLVINNPQTNWTNFHKEKVQDVLHTIYDGISLDDYREKYKERHDPIYLFLKKNYIPNIIYMQNIADRFHYENHYKPFISKITSDMFSSTQRSNKLISILYDEPSEGHNPATKELTLTYIEHAVQGVKNYMDIKFVTNK
ncbi:MAG: hypothetical protein RL571_845 [Pseudomonadota bacterium]|jgi:hypothetical protein